MTDLGSFSALSTGTQRTRDLSTPSHRWGDRCVLSFTHWHRTSKRGSNIHLLTPLRRPLCPFFPALTPYLEKRVKCSPPHTAEETVVSFLPRTDTVPRKEGQNIHHLTPLRRPLCPFFPSLTPYLEKRGKHSPPHTAEETVGSFLSRTDTVPRKEGQTFTSSHRWGDRPSPLSFTIDNITSLNRKSAHICSPTSCF